MALLGRNKKQQAEQQPKQQSKKKGGVLNAIGIQTEAVPTDAQMQSAKIDEEIILAWKYLRSRIDAAINDYYKTQTFAKLDTWVERPASDALKQLLESLRAQNIYWQQPDRNGATEPTFRVISKEMSNDGRHPTKFVIQERFRDFSTHTRVANGQSALDSQCHGTERVIQCTVTVRSSQDYKLHSVIQVHGATI